MHSRELLTYSRLGGVDHKTLLTCFRIFSRDAGPRIRGWMRGRGLGTGRDASLDASGRLPHPGPSGPEPASRVVSGRLTGDRDRAVYSAVCSGLAAFSPVHRRNRDPGAHRTWTGNHR